MKKSNEKSRTFEHSLLDNAQHRSTKIGHSQVKSQERLNRPLDYRKFYTNLWSFAMLCFILR